MSQAGRMAAIARYRTGLYALVFALWTGIHLSPLVPGLIAKEFFDALSGDARLGLTLWGLVALVVATGLARVALIYAGVRTDVRLRFHMSSLLRHNLLARRLSVPGADALPRSLGEVISTFRDDIEQVEESVDWFIDVVGTALFALTALAILMTVDARLTLSVFLPLLGVVAAVRFVRARLSRYREASRRSTADVTGAIGEAFAAVEAVELAGARDHFEAHFRALGDARRDTMVRDNVLSQVLDSVFANTASLGTGLVLLLGARAMQEGDFSVGDFALFAYYLGFVTDFTRFFGNFLAHYRQTGVAFDRLDVLQEDAPPGALVAPAALHLDAPPPPPEPVSPPPTRFESLEVRGLRLLYPDTGRGVRGFDAQVVAGRLTVVTGRVGAGKTTALRALLGLLRRDAGEILWNGEPVDDPAWLLATARCAYTPQVPHLVTGTLRANILPGATPGHARHPHPVPNDGRAEADVLARAIHLAALEDVVAALPEGLDTQVGPRGLRLSGGQVQRVAVARMVARPAQLWVLDDLSSALDRETEAALLDRLLTAGPSCLVVSHRRPVLERAAHVIVLEEGRSVAAGPPAEVLAASPVLRALWSAEA